jgi:hypothetical protein
MRRGLQTFPPAGVLVSTVFMVAPFVILCNNYQHCSQPDLQVNHESGFGVTKVIQAGVL